MWNRWVAVVIGAIVMLVPSDTWRAPARNGLPPPFESWREALIEEAVDRGFERRFARDILGDLQPLPRVVESDRSQAQSPPPLEQYLSERVTAELVTIGREMMRSHEALLEAIERDFGVDRRFIVAIWGAESGYGRYTGDVPVFQALATLAWEPRRAMYFRRELFDALQLLSAGDIEREALRGSWAGAMGQPQFMPSSYVAYAVDFDGDGRRDIWRSVDDTLASIANYLRQFGWRLGEPWGREVTTDSALRTRVDSFAPLRTRGCGALKSLTEPRRLSEWSARGVRLVRESDHAGNEATASLLTLEARRFLVQPNYETILAYNCSHRYALSVSLLADRIG